MTDDDESYRTDGGHPSSTRLIEMAKQEWHNREVEVQANGFSRW